MNSGKDVQDIFSTIFDVGSLTQEQRQELGPKLRDARKARGMKQEDVAVAANISRKTLSDLERGNRGAQPAVLSRVLTALDIPQVGDAETRYSEPTRLFIASAAPLFDRLPESEQPAAQGDVVALLAARLKRSTSSAGLRLVGGSTDDDLQRAASHDRGGLEETDLD